MKHVDLQDGWAYSAIAAGNFSPIHYPPHGEPRLPFSDMSYSTTVVSPIICLFESHCVCLPFAHSLYKQLVRPAQFSPEQLTRLPTKDEGQLFDACWLEMAAQRFHVAQKIDSQGLWSLFNKLAESFLRCRASITPQTTKRLIFLCCGGNTI